MTTEHIRRMSLAPEVAAHFGVPQDIEEWRFEVILALRNPTGYSSALRTINNLGLYCSMARMEWIYQGAHQCTAYFVQEEMAEAFFDCLGDLRSRILSEAASRGVSFVTGNSNRVTLN